MSAKMKGHKGSRKRFKVTGRKKLKRRKQGLRHLNSHMSGSFKASLRQPSVTDNAISKKYVQVLTER